MTKEMILPDNIPFTQPALQTGLSANLEPTLEHGGRLLAMAKKYGIAVEQWLDLSTGLNPDGWPVPVIPAHVWQALPQDEDELEAAARHYYSCTDCLPVAGSQAAIQHLPRLRKKSAVAIVSPTYAEHEHAWRKAGHQVKRIKLGEIGQQLDRLDVLVIINPNNPSGDRIDSEQLLAWHQTLVKKGGWLIVDEAFMDVTPGRSLVHAGTRPGLIVLRSLGKFFGLAGVRCGFVIAEKELLGRIKLELGPWSVTGPSRYVAIQALKDQHWQNEMRDKLEQRGKRLFNLLNIHGMAGISGSALFQWFKHPEAELIFDWFAKQGILLRLFDKTVTGTASLRFGLPGTEAQWQRLESALNALPGEFKNIAEDILETTSYA